MELQNMLQLFLFTIYGTGSEFYEEAEVNVSTRRCISCL
jgi:hypothetical protein